MAKDTTRNTGGWKRLRKLRIQNNLTVPQLARLASLHKTYVYQLEAGDRGASLDVLHRIALVFNVDVEELAASRPTVRPRVSQQRTRNSAPNGTAA